MDVFMTIVGLIGASCFALCTLPQILRVRKRKKTSDISLLFIILSLVGNLTSASYILYTNIHAHFWQYPQYFNYAIATTLVIILLCLKVHYDKNMLKNQWSNWIYNMKIDLRNIATTIATHSYVLVLFAFAILVGIFAGIVINM